MAYTTVERQRRENKHVKEGTKEDYFVKWRSERDSGLSEPRLIHQALQTNKGWKAATARFERYAVAACAVEGSSGFGTVMLTREAFLS